MCSSDLDRQGVVAEARDEAIVLGRVRGAATKEKHRDHKVARSHPATLTQKRQLRNAADTSLTERKQTDERGHSLRVRVRRSGALLAICTVVNVPGATLSICRRVKQNGAAPTSRSGANVYPVAPPGLEPGLS